MKEDEARAREIIGQWANIHNDDVEHEGYRELVTAIAAALTQARAEQRDADAKIADTCTECNIPICSKHIAATIRKGA